jgi:hypothetical protein
MRLIETTYRGKKIAHFPRDLHGLRRDRIDVPLSKIVGFDFETLNSPNRVLGLSISTARRNTWTWWPTRAGTPGIGFFLSALKSAFGEELAGTYYLFAHNLEFDLLRVLGPARAICLGMEIPHGATIPEDSTAWTVIKGVYADRVFLDIRSEDGVILRFRDTFGFFATSLDKAAKALGFPPRLRKIAKPIGLGEVDPRTQGPKKRKEFERYATRDAEIARRIGLVIDSFHEKYDVGGMDAFTVSGPHMASKVFQRMLDKETIPGIRSKEIMEAGIKAYAGGRSGGTFRGVVDDVWCYDVNSMYPCAMATIPNFVGAQMHISTSNRLPRPGIEGLVRVSGFVRERKHPGLMTWSGRLLPVVGRFSDLWVTTYELRSAIAWKEFAELHIERGIYVAPRRGKPNVLREFVLRMWKDRRAAQKRGDKVTDVFVKICLLNSLYGKFVQVNDGFRVPARSDHIAIPPGLPEKEMNELRRLYVEGAQSGREGTAIAKVFTRLDVLRHSNIEAFTRPPREWRDLDSIEASTGGLYQIVIGALITGWSRALLHDLMRITDAVYYDTDSVFSKMGPTELRRRLRRRLYRGQHLPKMGSGLGNLKVEAHGRGEFRQVKRYIMRDARGRIVKEAHHGLPGGVSALANDLGLYSMKRMVSLRGSAWHDDEAVGSIEERDYSVEDSSDARIEWGADGWGLWRPLDETLRLPGR